MSAYRYEIVQTLIVDIEPDEHVKRVMNEINAGICSYGHRLGIKRLNYVVCPFAYSLSEEELMWLKDNSVI